MSRKSIESRDRLVAEADLRFDGGQILVRRDVGDDVENHLLDVVLGHVFRVCFKRPKPVRQPHIS
jgi:hypothetical protein